jgi:nucleotide-binding universal stress UspA family protein
LRRAGSLARERDAELTIVHVVEDEQPSKLIGLETREAERILREQISVVEELRGLDCRIFVLQGDPFDGILRAAASLQADLIVMGAHRKQLLRDIFIGTTIERVIRLSRKPVLMVNNDRITAYRSVLAAVDVQDASANAIKVSKTLGFLRDVRVTLVRAFDPLAKGKLSSGGVGRASVDQYVTAERLHAKEELATFLNSNAALEPRWAMLIEDGAPFEVISRAVQRVAPDLIVLGTRNRSGITRVVLGSVSEEVLRSVELDVLTVPPTE